MPDERHHPLTWFTQLRVVHAVRDSGTEVWHARDGDGREIALKLIRRDQDPEVQRWRNERFQLEKRASSEIRRRGVLRQLLYFGNADSMVDYPDGVDYLAFEWVDGVDLRTLLQERRRDNLLGLSAREWFDLAKCVANGLAAVHGAADPPWIHRDVKPANVLLRQSDCSKAVLADMGIAWRQGSPSITKQMGLGRSGTLQYMSPEQMDDHDLDPSADLYSFALLLWESAMAEVPYTIRKNDGVIARGDTLRERRKAAPLPALELDATRAPGLTQVLQQALRPSPTDRWPDAKTFLRELHDAGVRDGVWDVDISFPLTSVAPQGIAPSDQPTETGDRSLIHSSESTQQIADEEYELPAVWVEQKSHLAAFVGRRALLNRYLAWLRGGDTASYLLLTGPPGQGKSALLARLAAEEGASGDPHIASLARGCCLLHMTKSRRAPHRILQALISQADRLLGYKPPEIDYRADIEDLRDRLLGRLRTLVQRTGRVAIIVDALDEVSEGAKDLHFLPPHLPEGVKCILSSRPDTAILDAARAWLRRLEEESVPPLSEEDLSLVAACRLGLTAPAIDRVLPVGELLAHTGGNPLFLSCALDVISRTQTAALMGGKRISLADVPRSMNAVFRDLYQRAVKRDDPILSADQIRARKKILHLLSCAYDPLSEGDLRGLLRTAGIELTREDFGQQLDAVSPVLCSVSHRFVLFHEGMADYVRTTVLDDDGVVNVHGLFVEWLNAMGPGASEYQLHLLDHLRSQCDAVPIADASQRLATLQRWIGAAGSLRLVKEFVDRGAVYEWTDAVAAFQQMLRTVSQSNPWTQSHSTPKTWERLEAELQVLTEWIRFLDERSHILAQWPALLEQELRNATSYKSLKALVDDLPITRPQLVLRRSAASKRGISRLVRQTVQCPGIEAVICDKDGQLCITSHYGSVRMWYPQTGAEASNELRGRYRTVADHANHRAITFWTSHPPDSWSLVTALTLDSEMQEYEIRWPSTEPVPNLLVPAGNLMFGAPRSLTGEGPAPAVLTRIDWKSGEVRQLTELPVAPKAIAASSDGAWIVLCSSSCHGEAATISVLDGSAGTVLREVALEEPAGSLAVSPCRDVLLSISRDRIRFWAVPELRALGELARDGVDSWVFHPTLPFVLLHDYMRVRVVDLTTLSVIRCEWWTQVPTHSQIVQAGRMLVGGIRNPIGSEFSETGLGIWDLPATFWMRPEEGAETDVGRDIDLTNPVVAKLHDGRIWTRPFVGYLLEFGKDPSLPVRAFTASFVERSIAIRPYEGGIVFASAREFTIFDADRNEVVSRFSSHTDACVGLAVGSKSIRAYVRPSSLPPDGDAPMGNAATNDEAVAELLARGIFVQTIDTLSTTKLLLPLPWSQEGDGTTREMRMGCATLDPLKGEWSGFVEFPHEDEPDEWFEMPGGRYVVFGRFFGDSSIIDNQSGAVLCALDSLYPLCALGDSTVLCCASEGNTVTLNVKNGATEHCGLELGWEPFISCGFSITAAPNGRLVAFSAEDAIIVAELPSGREVARYPTRAWEGTLLFEDDTRILVRGRLGEELVLALEGYVAADRP